MFSSRQTQVGIHYLSTKPQLSCQVVMTNLLRELHTEVSVGTVVGDTFIHDLADDVQDTVLHTNTKDTTIIKYFISIFSRSVCDLDLNLYHQFKH